MGSRIYDGSMQVLFEFYGICTCVFRSSARAGFVKITRLFCGLFMPARVLVFHGGPDEFAG